MRGIAGAILLLALAAPARDQGRPVTNADVASMVKAGLPESTIVRAIQLAIRHGQARFDISPGALIALKEQGATEAVLNAVLAAPPPPPPSPVPGLPEQSGLYYKAGEQWVALEYVLLWPPFYVREFNDRDYDISLPGASARVQLAERRPVLYARGIDTAEPWILVQAVLKKERRELRIRSGGIFTQSFRFRDADARPLEVRELGADVVSITPAAPLEPGEYALCAAVPGGRGLLVCYTFGIKI